MQYIGNKQSLVHSIFEIMQKNNIEGETILDIFAGTHSIGKFFKEKGYTVYANDWQTYSYVCGKALVENNTYPTFKNLEEQEWFKKVKEENLELDNYNIVLKFLNELEGIEGFFYENYCPGGTKDQEHIRLYFKDENGKRFDAIRQKIEEFKNESLITEHEYFVLVYGLIRDLDIVANTTSVYGAFLKKLKKTALKDMQLKPLEFIINGKNHKIFKDDAVNLAKNLKSDIVYLDPPYNTRQYSSNYHVLETMALYDNPEIRGKTGLRDYEHQKSPFSSKTKVKTAFAELVEALQTKYIVFSYNEEGILKHEDIMEILNKKGKAFFEEIDYKRFRSDKDGENRNYKADRVKELVYICIVE